MTVISAALVVGMTLVPAFAQDSGQPSAAALARVAIKKLGYSPYAGRVFPTRPFFGDTHVHTSSSFDSSAFGATPIGLPVARRSSPTPGGGRRSRGPSIFSR